MPQAVNRAALESWLDQLDRQLDLESLMRGCCEALSEISGADRCSIMVLDADTDQLVVRWASGARVRPGARKLKFRLGEGMCGWVARNQKMYCVADASRDPRFVPYRGKPTRFRPVKAICCLPLVAEGRTVGVVNLSSFSTTRHSFKGLGAPAARRFLDRLARVIWQAVLVREAQALSQRWRRQAKAASDTVAQVSHEVRTPLTLVQEASAQLLEGFGGKLTQEQEERVKMIRKQSQRMLQLAGELLDLSCIEAGRLPLRREVLHLEGMIREVAGRYQALVYPRRLNLEIDPAPPVYGDPVRLTQVLENLLTNAVKFTPTDGSITVGLSVQGRAAQVSVADTGIGIPPKEQKRIFEKFSQLKVPASMGERGTGLGLAIVKEIVTLHGGTVGVVSRQGKGAVFMVSIPLYSPSFVKGEA